MHVDEPNQRKSSSASKEDILFKDTTMQTAKGIDTASLVSELLRWEVKSFLEFSGITLGNTIFSSLQTMEATVNAQIHSTTLAYQPNGGTIDNTLTSNGIQNINTSSPPSSTEDSPENKQVSYFAFTIF